MKSFFSLVALTLLSTTQLLSQKVSMPINSAFYDSDVKNFWVAFDMLNKDCKNPFHEFYIAKGTKGLESFMAGRIVNADSLFNTVLRRKDDYEKARTKTENMLEKKLECLQAYKKLKELYRNAIFPPVYFLIGRYNSGGHSSRAGIVIGAEMVDSASIPFLVSHELIHYQQKKIPKKKLDLLSACINEGSADFIAELISGKSPGKKNYEYGSNYEAELWAEFRSIMFEKSDNHGWLYDYHPKNGRPADLGYWIGYKITKSYYQKSKDKRKAISEILQIKDFRKFLSDSGYPNNQTNYLCPN